MSFSRCFSLSDYPSDWSLLPAEWQRGILYSDKQHVTVPLQQLEKDLAEGRQQVDISYAPWCLLNRKATHHRKFIICSMLGAVKAGQELEDFTNPYHCQAEFITQAAQGKKRSKASVYEQLIQGVGRQEEAQDPSEL